MSKIVLIPDSFKGTLGSGEICRIIAEQASIHLPEAEVVSVPVADGGEGTVEAFLAALGGQRIELAAKGPYMEELTGFYGLVNNGETAVIEMAACAGLPLVGENRQAHKTTTYGVGQLIADAAARGCRRIVLGLGGSATNDMGVGAAVACGARFYNEQGKSFLPVGETLGQIAAIDLSGVMPALGKVELTAMCDIDNPLCGKKGAAYVFAPQKGADGPMVEFLDSQLKQAAQTVRRELGMDIAGLPGAGAAGGMGGGMTAFLGARLQPGIETVLDLVGFDALARDARLVITGEGRLDGQSLRGKVVVGVARRARTLGVPVIALVGGIGDDIAPVYGEGVTAVFSINPEPVDFAVAKGRARENLAQAAENLFRLVKALG